MSEEQITALIEKTLAFEGGYSNDSEDPGMETKWGISRKSFPDLDIANLTKEQAIQIYREKYWEPVSNFREPDFLSNRILWKLFDIAVNMGMATAESFWDKVMDGLNISFSDDKALHQLSALQMKRYGLIIKAKPSQVKYLQGWITRAMTI